MAKRGNNPVLPEGNDERVTCGYCFAIYAGRFWHRHRKPCETCQSNDHATCRHR